jgi:hypothetical protein
VRLLSRDGGTSNGVDGTGKYPHFGSSVAGRVNFIENVKYNASPIGNAAAFDQYGGNISIKALAK